MPSKYVGTMLASAVALVCACTDFPTGPPLEIGLYKAEDWPREILVGDSDTLVAVVRDSTSRVITGLEIEWSSSDESVLSVVVPSPTNNSRRDSLDKQLTAIVTGVSFGRATVNVSVKGRRSVNEANNYHRFIVREKWIAVSAGRTHTCAITVRHDAYCWGYGALGALGTGGDTRSFHTPQRVAEVTPVDFSSISAGDNNTCGKSQTGATYCWGSGARGSLGIGDPTERVFVPTVISGGLQLRFISAGLTSCGITGTNQAYCWGDNSKLQLGVQPPWDSCADNLPCSIYPRRVGFNYQWIDVGTSHTCAVDQRGKGSCWGTAILGDGTTTASLDPVPVDIDVPLMTISVGKEHTCALAAEGTAFCWGRNDLGQLGIASMELQRVRPSTLSGSFEQLSSGDDHTCAISAGVAFCWGSGMDGQLGFGLSGRSAVALSPAPVETSVLFSSISSGARHTCGVSLEGTVFCWGDGRSGQIGGRGFESQLTPQRVLRSGIGPP